MEKRNHFMAPPHCPIAFFSLLRFRYHLHTECSQSRSYNGRGITLSRNVVTAGHLQGRYGSAANKTY